MPLSRWGPSRKVRAMSFDPAAPAAPDAGIFGLETEAEGAAIILLPVPFDATTSYGQGASRGPAAILGASHQVDLYDIDTGRPYEAGIWMHPESADIRAWNEAARALVDGSRHGAAADAIREVDRFGAQVNDWVYQQTRTWLERGRIVGVVGGDHATPFGCIKAYSERYPDLGILHVDAHADLRDAYEGFAWSHASIMHNVMQHTGVKKLVQVGIRDFAEAEKHAIDTSQGRIEAFYDRDLADAAFEGRPFARLVDAIVTKLPRDVYVSFDIDGLDPVLCPHTGTPVPGGLSFRQACALFAGLARSGRRIVGFDVNEVAPGPDGDEWDGNVGARLLYKLCGYSLLTRSQTS
jgi:agmatinase